MREFTRGRPGHRFLERYERNQRKRKDRPWAFRFLQLIIGIVVTGAGIFFCLIPGPGLPLVLIGAGLLASQSLVLARAMDWLELRVRKLFRLAKAWWARASRMAKYTVVFSAVLVMGGTGYGAYHFMLER